MDVPMSEELLAQANVTPRRTSFFRNRDSIMEGDLWADMLSPCSLKGSLKGIVLAPVF